MSNYLYNQLFKSSLWDILYESYDYSLFVSLIDKDCLVSYRIYKLLLLILAATVVYNKLTFPFNFYLYKS